MCRFAAFLSTREIPLFKFLIPGGNSFVLQSLDHPDGWGISHYQDGHPEVVKSVLPAIADPLFEEMCFTKQTKLLLGHIRRATTGQVSEVNSHPFCFREWTFVHNGQIANFALKRDLLLQSISDVLRSEIKGTTDSEIYFYLFMTNILELEKSNGELSLKDMVHQSLKRVVSLIRKTCDIGEEKSSLTCLVSNGSMLCGLSVHKNLSFRGEIEGPDRRVYFSSEAMAPPNNMKSTQSWRELRQDQLVYVDKLGHYSTLSI